jgi:predicted PurR-regulated permease PerM
VILTVLLSLAYLAWTLRVEIVILFAAILFGVSLYAAGRWVSRKTGLGQQLSVALCAGAVVVFIGGFLFLTQHRLRAQYGELGSRLPAALQAAEDRLEGIPVLGTVGRQLEDFRESLTEDGGSADAPDAGAADSGGASGDESGSDEEQGDQSQDGASRPMQIVQVSLVALGRVGLVIILAFYMAFDGRRYIHGLLRLFPPDRRELGSELVRGIGTALPLWLLGRLSSMAVVAVLTAPGLMLLGIPLAFVLALIAGLFSFVPVLGPIASVVPALLITLEAAPSRIVWVLALYGAVQILESWFVTPRIQDRMADVPPVILLSAQFILGGLVGLVGVMFSTPVALAVLVAFQVVYVRRTLEHPIRLPGEPLGGEPSRAAGR